jgi:hypothetical protein
MNDKNGMKSSIVDCDSEHLKKKKNNETWGYELFSWEILKMHLLSLLFVFEWNKKKAKTKSLFLVNYTQKW